MKFTEQPLSEVLQILRDWRREAAPGDELFFRAPHPDTNPGCYTGSTQTIAGRPIIVRSLRTWLDIAELLDCQMRMPTNEGAMAGFRFRALNRQATPHDSKREIRERYGVASHFAKINKLEDPWFVDTLIDAFEVANLKQGDHVLDLGCNRGDTFALLKKVLEPNLFSSLRLTGVDHSPSALALAAERFPEGRFLEADIRSFENTDLQPCNLLLCLGTLQSPELEGKVIFPSLLKRLSAPDGSVILAFPNVRYFDGELSYGARMKNYSQPEYSLLVKDLFHYRRHLQKKGYRVRLHGKYDIFVVADKPRP